MKFTVTGVAVVAAAVALAGCGSSTTLSARPASSIQQLSAATPALNVLELATGTDPQRIAATIRAFYRATWQNHGAEACSLFSAAGARGFVQAAKVAFPSSVSSTTTCAQAMAFFNADLADSAGTLQQAGVNVSGNILDDVGVDHIAVSGATATAHAPEGVEEFIQPKLFVMVKRGNRWYIEASRKIGQTLPQLLAEAKKKDEPIPPSARTGAPAIK
jgi:hypothetical protein